MANSFYDINVNTSTYWCNDLPEPESFDCLVVIPKKNGDGNCLYSSTCDQPRGAVCECVCSEMH